MARLSVGPNLQAPEDWACDWDAQERRKYTIGLDATPEQRLEWLEEMIELAHASGALPRRREDGSGRSGTP
jgi:hypothetical protein